MKRVGKYQLMITNTHETQKRDILIPCRYHKLQDNVKRLGERNIFIWVVPFLEAAYLKLRVPYVRQG
ncbi:CLUMA_CG012851, isoform A [Clunio marinus]|uniref:CLUMA_CG012851, isoform A n=1 Tax=Clunio marinus TaxID=568069 RepID=A0A1J1IJ15_9DIPT|nr:CLUMA_CG012851, isoform A [Clunio marinus]